MSDDINSTRRQLWAKLTDEAQGKAYRDAFVASQLSTNIASQIFCMRDANGWTQQQLAERAGMAQTRISLLENPSYQSHSISTLKRVASAFDVALVVRFVPYSELVDWVTTAGPEKLAPPSIENDEVHLVPEIVSLSGATPEMGAAQADLGGWNTLVITVPGDGKATIQTTTTGPRAMAATFPALARQTA